MKIMSKRLKFEMKSRDVIQTKRFLSFENTKHHTFICTLTGLFSSCSKKAPAELSLEEKLSGRMEFTIINMRWKLVPFDSAEYFIDFD